MYVGRNVVAQCTAAVHDLVLIQDHKGFDFNVPFFFLNAFYCISLFKFSWNQVQLHIANFEL